MKPQQNIQPHNNNTGTDNGSGKYSILIDKIVECANNHLLMFMNQMLSTADEKLNAEAKKAKTEAERNKYTACTKLFCTERNDTCSS